MSMKFEVVVLDDLTHLDIIKKAELIEGTYPIYYSTIGLWADGNAGDAVANMVANGGIVHNHNVYTIIEHKDYAILIGSTQSVNEVELRSNKSGALYVEDVLQWRDLGVYRSHTSAIAGYLAKINSLRDEIKSLRQPKMRKLPTDEDFPLAIKSGNEYLWVSADGRCELSIVDDSTINLYREGVALILPVEYMVEMTTQFLNREYGGLLENASELLADGGIQ